MRLRLGSLFVVGSVVVAACGGDAGNLDVALAKPVIVYVHGTDKADTNKDALWELWDASLFDETDRSQLPAVTSMAFYGVVRSSKGKTLEKEFSVKPLQTVEVGEDAFLADLLSLLGDHDDPALLEYARVFAADFDDALADQDEEVGPELLPTRWLRRWALLVATSIKLKDVRAYLLDADIGDRMREIVRSEIQTAASGGGNLIVIAHSLGSVIAYDVLREFGDDIHVVLFLTIGSPLGRREIQDHLKEPLTVPENVDCWYNAYYVLDLVAAGATLRRDFTPPFIKDKNVHNPASFPFHAAEGYLQQDFVQKTVTSAFDGCNPDS